MRIAKAAGRPTYAMLDARGHFFRNATGAHTYEPSGFEVSICAAQAPVGSDFSAPGFEARGGADGWAEGAEDAALEQLSAGGEGP